MEPDEFPSDILPTGSVYKVFHNYREDPPLPQGYDWKTQKDHYSPSGLLKKSFPNPPTLNHEYGYVFCHRGLYERALRILDNTIAAIENGLKHDLFLHEVDAFVREKLDRAFVAHDKNARRITAKKLSWDSYSLHEILKTPLVSRRVDNTDTSLPELASSYLSIDEKVNALFPLLWKENLKPSGLTLQIDFREEDFAKAIAFYSFHLSKQPYQYENVSGAHHTLVWKLFQPIILKGYNKHYKSFDHLHRAVTEASEDIYGKDYFQIRHLPLFPPLIMVFYAMHLVQLADEKTPKNPQWDPTSYEHLHDTFMDQVRSFVDVGKDSYNFILEIAHSGLGLHYDRDTKRANNPLTGAELTEENVVFDSLVDRVMIDVSLQLRQEHPNLLFASCTRLPDVITPKGKFKAAFDSSELVKLPAYESEAGLATKLRAMHGGLYPRSDLVVADDPTAEIAARTWIDEVAGLDRSQLLNRTYHEWIDQADEKVIAAMEKLNSDFLPNKIGDPIPEETASLGDPDYPIYSTGDVEMWLSDISSSTRHEDNLNTAEAQNADEGDEGSESDESYIRGQEIGIPDDNYRIINKGGLWKSMRLGPDGDLDPEEVALKINGTLYEFFTGTKAKRLWASLALYKAAEEGEEESVRSTLREGAYINASMEQFGTALAVACRNGHESIVQFLVEKGADIDKQTPYGSPLELASQYGHVTIVKLLLEAGAKLDNGRGSSRCLEFASQNGHEELVKELLAKGKENRYSGTLLTGYALQEACRSGHDCIVRLLLKSGADIEARNNYGKTALQIACEEGCDTTARLLIDEGANVNAASRDGITPLQAAGSLAENDIVKLLLERGAKGYWTLLLRTWLSSLYDVVKSLIGSAWKMVHKDEHPKPRRRMPVARPPPRLESCNCLICIVDQETQPTISRFKGLGIAVSTKDPVTLSLKQIRLRNKQGGSGSSRSRSRSRRSSSSGVY